MGALEMSHRQLLLTAPDGSAKSPGHLRGGAALLPPHPTRPGFRTLAEGLYETGGLARARGPGPTAPWRGEGDLLGWRPRQMRETDVSQMLTAGVGLEAVGGVPAFGCGGGAEAGVEDTDPPRVCTHADTYAGLGLEDNSPFQDAAQAGSPSLLGREGKAPEYLSPSFSLLNRKMRLGSIP